MRFLVLAKSTTPRYAFKHETHPASIIAHHLLIRVTVVDRKTSFLEGLRDSAVKCTWLKLCSIGLYTLS